MDFRMKLIIRVFIQHFYSVNYRVIFWGNLLGCAGAEVPPERCAVTAFWRSLLEARLRRDASFKGICASIGELNHS